MKKSKLKSKIKNSFLYFVTLITFTLLLICMSALDSDTLLPHFICLGCLCWLVPFCVANGIIKLK